MRRLLGLCAVLVVTAGGWALIGAATSDGSASYRVDALFDTGGFLIPGQDVKIAGAIVGRVQSVSLTANRKARISMQIDRAFAPFRSDADCTIQPQSLIGEQYIQCTPGTPQGRPLKSDEKHPPTVPLSRTHSPIDLDLVLNTFRQPATQRLSLLLDALGNGLTGHGDDLNAALRRANPALAETQRLLSVVNQNRSTIRQLIGESDRVIATLAGRREDVAHVVRDAGAVTQTAARRRRELERTLHDLPDLLTQARPALDDLTALATQGQPATADLRAAAPGINRVVRAIPPFVLRARPTLATLSQTARTARQVVPSVAPQLRRLARTSGQLTPATDLAAQLLTSSREKGALEGLLRFLYYGAAVSSRFDSVGHIIPAYVVVDKTCSLYALVPVAGCDAHFAAGGARTKAADKSRRRPAATGSGSTSKAPDPSPPAAEQPSAPAAPGGGGAPPQVPPAVDDLLKKALGGLLGSSRPEPAPPPPDKQSLAPLLDYLLGGGG